MGKPAVVVDNVSMKFNLSKEKVDNLKDYLIKFIKKEIKYNEFWALQNVDFEVKKGDRVGILGLNGAGKSTLLKTISGLLKPAAGSIIHSSGAASMIGSHAALGYIVMGLLAFLLGVCVTVLLYRLRRRNERRSREEKEDEL